MVSPSGAPGISEAHSVENRIRTQWKHFKSLYNEYVESCPYTYTKSTQPIDYMGAVMTDKGLPSKPPLLFANLNDAKKRCSLADNCTGIRMVPTDASFNYKAVGMVSKNFYELRGGQITPSNAPDANPDTSSNFEYVYYTRIVDTPIPLTGIPTKYIYSDTKSSPASPPSASDKLAGPAHSDEAGKGSGSYKTLSNVRNIITDNMDAPSVSNLADAKQQCDSDDACTGILLKGSNMYQLRTGEVKASQPGPYTFYVKSSSPP